MKKFINVNLHFTTVPLIVICFLLIVSGCQKTSDVKSLSAESNFSDAQAYGYTLGDFSQINLVANTNTYGAPHVNSNLHNAWGMSESPGGTFWISAADGGVSFVYDRIGNRVIDAVSIPSHLAGSPGNPTGNIFNATTDFIITGTGATAKFIFASEDGTVSGWNGGTSAVVVADRSKQGAGYTGLAIANNNGNNFLYVANFAKGKIDVFDKNFKHVQGKSFLDNDIPEGYAPFGIREINNMLYVTYAIRASTGDDSTGAGLGFVDVFSPDGSLAKKFAAHGTLNAPWGIVASAPSLLGKSAVLIGNFGDGRINVFDWDGNFRGFLSNKGKPLQVDGLWAIDNGIAKTSFAKQLYFTAGPNEESDGVFGFLYKN